MARCDWCLDHFDAVNNSHTVQELGWIKTKLFIPDAAEPLICQICYETVKDSPLLGITPALYGNRTLLGH